MNGPNMPPSRCPTCQYEMDCATGLKDDQPQTPIPGDISLCLNCGQILIVTDALTMGLAHQEHLEGVQTTDLALLYKAQAYVRKRGPLR